MASPSDPNVLPAIEAERQLLRELCSGRISRGQVLSAVDQLANYEWLVPEHATVFQAVRRAVRAAGDSWREILPAQATRMGFPDVDWPEYFTSDEEDATLLNHLVSRLIG
jgi:hypothetical protein